MNIPHSLTNQEIRRHHYLILGFLLAGLLILLGIGSSPAGKAIAAQILPVRSHDEKKPEPPPMVQAPAATPFSVQAMTSAEEPPKKEVAPKPPAITATRSPAKETPSPEGAKSLPKAMPEPKSTPRQPKGEIKAGERLPALAIDDLDADTLARLERHKAARLIAQIRRGEKTQSLLIPPGTGQSSPQGRVRPLTKEEAAGLSTRNFPLDGSDPAIGLELWNYRVRQWLAGNSVSDAEEIIRYELRLTAGFDRRIAQLQREALAQAGIEPDDPRYTRARTRLRLEEDAKGLIPRVEME
ncbi:MAG: hypothetical protein KJ558_07990 [Gammaproteobacteria bacterium]|nr:hypothetical protein [Gammaproteobacteria bacterium]MBU1654754.1 hypothetical protein [Gammaproteobacteria bacterium]MBU1961629.1 hypothetical protein [Gammaproteobacteria bacterium]